MEIIIIKIIKVMIISTTLGTLIMEITNRNKRYGV